MRKTKKNRKQQFFFFAHDTPRLRTIFEELGNVTGDNE